MFEETSFGIDGIKVGRRKLLQFTACTIASKLLTMPTPVFAKPSRLELLVTFHDDRLSSIVPEYQRAVRYWDDDGLSIWNYLETAAAKERFARYVIKMDTLNKQEYIYDLEDEEYKTKNPGKKIDEERPFVCRHFARKMYYRYRKLEEHLDWTASDELYKIGRAPQKFRIPIREVEVTFPLASEHKRPHAVSAVYLGGNSYQAENWLFFDPQSDGVLFRSLSYQWDGKGNIFTIYPDHKLPLDKETKSPIETYAALENPSVVKFAINKNGNVVPVFGTGNQILTKGIYQHDYASVESQFPWSDQKKTLTVIQASGNFTFDEIMLLLEKRKR